MISSPERKLKQLREYKNYSQEYIATQLGISIRAYSKIENGETQLTFKRFNEICAILKMQPEHLLGLNEESLFGSFKGKINDANTDLTPKLIQQYEETILALKEQIGLLKLMIEK
ncbi:helix-turn-helix domain-containing protein [Flavobacterium sp.]|uniref:helix-turn-helix domain-containing protein n=1 Tax=Flavobacterium sp. TaxID=239 RepID=UPI003D11D460